MNKNVLMNSALCVSLFLSSCSILQKAKTAKTEKNLLENINEALKQENKKTLDPQLGYVPIDRLQNAISYYKEQDLAQSKTNVPFSSLKWQERGPNNIGGRTRAILFLTATKVLTAGVSGGMWLCNDITAATPTWAPVNDYLNSINFTCFAKESATVLYAGTGEGWNNFDAQRGTGIYKSTDGGITWNVLANTVNSNFTYVHKIIVTSSGHIYAATRGQYSNTGGLMKSTDNGNTWTNVVGGSVANGSRGTDIEQNAAGDLYYSSGIFSAGKVLKSSVATHGANVGNSGNWTDVTPSGSFFKIELTVSKQTGSDRLYAVCQGNGSNDVTGIFFSNDGGASWTSRSIPTICDQGSNSIFTRGQAWYDLVAEIDPANDAILYIAGIDMLKSTDSATAFTQITTWSNYWVGCGGTPPPLVHSDHHALVFNPFTANMALSGHDGGLSLSSTLNNSIPSWTSVNSNYNITQYYALSTHPTDTHYLITGAQDNGSHKLAQNGVGSASYASGGDGGYCHISKTNGANQITAYTNNNFYISTNNGSGFVEATSTNTGTGRFINPTDLDDVNNILYSAGNADVLERRSDIFGSITATTHNVGFDGKQITAIKVSPNTPSTIYVGNDDGKVYKITNANTTPVKSATWTVGATGNYISNIDVWKGVSGTDDTLLATVSNYGVNSVYISNDAGTTWTNIDDNSTLQDIPVRWGLFSKESMGKIFLATELGVFATNSINGASTAWTKVNNSSLPHVRCDMFDYDVDGNLNVATHGRGVWETKSGCSFSNPVVSGPGLRTSTNSGTDGTWTCYCKDDSLLLALNLTGSGAVIPTNGVQLKIGNPLASHIATGTGFVINPNGFTLLFKDWNVSPTTQPTNPVSVRYFVTAQDSAAISSSLTGAGYAPVPKLDSVYFYKITNSSLGAFPALSSITTSDIIPIRIGSVPTTDKFIKGNAINGTQYVEYKVSSFSGGGGGMGGGNIYSPLPLYDINLFYKVESDHIKLDWTSNISGENINSYSVYRGSNLNDLKIISTLKNNVSSFIDLNTPTNYDHLYYYISAQKKDGTSTISNMIYTDKQLGQLSMYPNPVKDQLFFNSHLGITKIELYNIQGKLQQQYDITTSMSSISLKDLPTGNYFITIFNGAGVIEKRMIMKN